MCGRSRIYNTARNNTFINNNSRMDLHWLPVLAPTPGVIYALAAATLPDSDKIIGRSGQAALALTLAAYLVQHRRSFKQTAGCIAAAVVASGGNAWSGAGAAVALALSIGFYTHSDKNN